MTGNKVKIWAYLLPLLLFACTESKEELVVSDDGNPSLTFMMTRASEDIISNSQVYLFDGEGPSIGQFKMKVPGVTYGTDRLTMSVAAGKWDLMLVSADTDISGDLTMPVRGNARSSLKMWESHSVSGELPSMPELRTAYLAGQQVIANQSNTASETALLSRNVALVKVVIADAGGLDVTGDHHFKLTDVPTTLNWAGGLFPNKTNPTVSSDPMTGTFAVQNNALMAGHQYSDTLQFIVPAHKGSDYLNAAPTDTTTHNLKLSVDLACEGGTRFVKEDVVIPRVPRVNGILLVRLFLGGKLDITTEILDWKDVAVNADLSQTMLYTDKASVGLAYKDTLYVNTNASSFTVDKAAGATWITSLRKLGNNAVEITANVDTYVDNNPRTSYITIKANNVTKQIPVTQRPDRGTISADNKRLVFCPTNHKTRTVNITSLGGDWEFITHPYKATPNAANGTKGTKAVTFTRASTTNEDDFDKYYGDTIIVVKNKQTLDTDTISLVNCFIYMYQNTINANAPTGTNQTAVTISDDIVVYGGNKNLIFTDFSNWIHAGIDWNPSTQKITFTTDREPDDEARTGYMSFYHQECSDYKVKADVYQDIIVTIPAFDYYVLKFTWSAGNDVDIAVEFAGNSLVTEGANNDLYDKIPVGFSMQNHNKGKGVTGTGGGINSGRVSFDYKGQTLLEWGGDATSKQGETAFFNAPIFEGDANSPRKIKMEIYAYWFSGTAGKPMYLSSVAYKDGTMYRGDGKNGTNAYNFYNRGGTKLYSSQYEVIIDTSGSSIPSTGGSSKYDTGGYTHVATLTYDRVKHSAGIVFHTTASYIGEADVLRMMTKAAESEPAEPVYKK